MNLRQVITGLLACSIASGAAACSHASSMSIPLSWRPKADLEAIPPQILQELAHHPVRVAAFTVLQDRVIGDNIEGDSPRQVTTSEDIGGFVQNHVAGLLRDALVPVVLAGEDRVLRGEVTQFFVRENHRYHGTIVVHFELETPDGHPLWEGSMVGRSDRSGHSFDAENYQETFSSALVLTVQELMKSPSFRDAIVGHPGSVAGGSTGAGVSARQ